MDLALQIAKSGLDAQHHNIEIISHNLANSNTAGYKRSRAEFEDLAYQTITLPGSALTSTLDNPTGLMIGTGVRLVANRKTFQDGPQVQTFTDKDIAIVGKGFLQVQLPNGNNETAYTRDGRLAVNETGQLTTSEGMIVQPPVTLPAGYINMSVSSDGVISVTTQGSSTPQQVGQLQLATFMNDEGLEPIGQNLFKETVASGTATTSNPGTTGAGIIRFGSYEGSNVNVVEEMVNLIEAQRGFEVTSKAITAVDGMLRNIAEVT